MQDDAQGGGAASVIPHMAAIGPHGSGTGHT